MKLAVGADHAGFDLKEDIKSFLVKLGHEVLDVGTYCGKEPFDYTGPAAQVGWAVSRGECRGGVLICGTGVGMSVAANKLPGIRAAVCNELFTARLAKRDVDLNVLCLGGRILAPRLAQEIVAAWLDEEFEGGRFLTRLANLDQLELEGARQKVATNSQPTSGGGTGL